MFKLYQILLDLIFPIFCLSCWQEGAWLCNKCHGELKVKIKNQADGDILPHAFDRFFVAFEYKQTLLPEMLHTFKYKSVKGLGEPLSGLVIEYLQELGERIPFQYLDYVVPVPLSKKRQLARGFNQSEAIARSVCDHFGWQLSTGNLIRKLDNRPQVGLSAQERRHNVKNIFSVSEAKFFHDKTVLVVDDVVTTGSTMAQCAKELKKAGVKEVWGLVLFKS